MHSGRIGGTNGIGNHQTRWLVLHQAVHLLQHQRFFDGSLIGALKRHSEIGVDIDAFRCRTIQNLLPHDKRVLEALADIVLVHLFSGRERDGMTANTCHDGQFVSLHVGYQRAVGKLCWRKIRGYFVRPCHLGDGFGRHKRPDLKLGHAGLGKGSQ